jgi:hypothetical protein
MYVAALQQQQLLVRAALRYGERLALVEQRVSEAIVYCVLVDDC